MLYTYKNKLVDHLPPDVKQNIDGYIQSLEAICRMHRERFLPKLRQCDMSVEEICNLFNDFISVSLREYLIKEIFQTAI